MTGSPSGWWPAGGRGSCRAGLLPASWAGGVGRPCPRGRGLGSGGGRLCHPVTGSSDACWGLSLGLSVWHTPAELKGFVTTPSSLTLPVDLSPVAPSCVPPLVSNPGAPGLLEKVRAVQTLLRGWRWCWCESRCGGWADRCEHPQGSAPSPPPGPCRAAQKEAAQPQRMQK